MKKWNFSGAIILASILLVVQYYLAFFVYKMPGLKVLHWMGWVIWFISLIFGFAPIFILSKRGGVAKGDSYVKTTRLVDSSLYAIVRHPQYVAGMLFNLALMFLAQHWVVFFVGAVSMISFYIDIPAADQDGIEKFGEDYREYMQRVPQVNFLLGIFRVIKKEARKA